MVSQNPSININNQLSALQEVKTQQQAQIGQQQNELQNIQSQIKEALLGKATQNLGTQSSGEIVTDSQVQTNYGASNIYVAAGNADNILDQLRQKEMSMMQGLQTAGMELNKTDEQIQQLELQQQQQMEAQQELDSRAAEQKQQTSTPEQAQEQANLTPEQKFSQKMVDGARQLAQAQGIELPEGMTATKDPITGDTIYKATVGEGEWAEEVSASNVFRLKEAFDNANQTQVVVQNGESIQDLADKYGVTPQQLIEANPDLVQSYDIKNERGESTGKTLKGFKSGAEIKVPKKINPELLKDNLSAEEAKVQGNNAEKARQAQYAQNQQAAAQQTSSQSADSEQKTETRKAELKSAQTVATKLNKEITKKSFNTDTAAILDNEVTSENAAEIILAYRENSSGESLAEAISDETFNFTYEKRTEMLNTLYDKLAAEAESLGIDTSSYYRDLHTHTTETGTGSINRIVADYINTKKMDQVFEGLAAAISNVKEMTPTELATVNNASFEENKDMATDNLQSTLDNAKASLKQQKDSEGWVGKTVDALSAAWNSQNRAELVEADINKFETQLTELKNSTSEAEFNAKFKEMYGVDYNPVMVKGYEKRQEQMEAVNIAYSTEQDFKKNVSELLNNKTLQAKTQTDMDGRTVTTETKADVLNNAINSLSSTLGIEDKDTLMELAGIEAGDSPDVQWSKMRDLATGISSNLHSTVDELTGGKGFNAFATESQKMYNAAFGTKNDIARRVEIYNQSQRNGEMALKGGAKVILAGAATICTGNPLVGGMIVAGISTAVDVSDKVTSANGLQDGDLSQILKDAAIDGGVVALTGGLGKAVKAMELGAKASIAAKTAGQAAIATGADYARTGQVTAGGVLKNLAFGYVGNKIAVRSAQVGQNLNKIGQKTLQKGADTTFKLGKTEINTSIKMSSSDISTINSYIDLLNQNGIDINSSSVLNELITVNSLNGSLNISSFKNSLQNIIDYVVKDPNYSGGVINLA